MSRISVLLSGSGRACAAGAAVLLITVAIANATEKTGPAKIEEIPGSDVKRVILTAKAAERTGIQTAPLVEEAAPRRIVVRGEVEEDPDGQSLVRVDRDFDADGEDDIGADDHDDVDEIDDAEILTPSLKESDYDDDDAAAHYLRAERVAVASVNGKSTDVLYFRIKSGTQALRPGQRVGVKMTEPGSGALKKVVPYAAVIYDVHGDTWVYTNPEPLVFVRSRVDIEYFDRDMAVLRDGPELGTQIVVIGAAELLGAESGVGH